MTLHVTSLTSEELPEPGQLRRVVSVHAGNRTYETVPAGHEPGWLVAAPHSTNPVYWTDDEAIGDGRNGWVMKDGVPGYVLSRHGALPEPSQPEPTPRFRRTRRPSAVPEPSTNETQPGEGDGES